MLTLGIIAEFNPFHKGHEYIISEAKRITGADRCVIAMSGDFVQRGEPAVCDKYLRARMALECGADAVFELPVPYSTGSAEIFAEAGIKLLTSLSCVDYVAFGSECGDIDAIMTLAGILVNEPAAYKETLKSELKKGVSFPAARETALLAEIGTAPNGIPQANYAEIVKSPNNILAIEYCKAIIRMRKYFGDRLHIPAPVTIARVGSGYSDSRISEGLFASATAVRSGLLACCPKSIPRVTCGYEIDGPLMSASTFAQLPEPVAETVSHEFFRTLPIAADDLTDMLHIRLATMSDGALEETSDVTHDLANAVRNHFNPVPALTFTKACEALKSKNITYSAVSRALLHITLGIDRKFVTRLKNNSTLPYARLLGFRAQASDILRLVSDNPDCVLITKLGDARNQLSDNPEALELLETDLRASAAYAQLVRTKFGTVMKTEFERGIEKTT